MEKNNENLQFSTPPHITYCQNHPMTAAGNENPGLIEQGKCLLVSLRPCIFPPVCAIHESPFRFIDPLIVVFIILFNFIFLDLLVVLDNKSVNDNY